MVKKDMIYESELNDSLHIYATTYKHLLYGYKPYL